MAEKTVYWLGGDSADANDANIAANWSGATKPDDDDTVLFDERAGDDAGTGKKYACDWSNFADACPDFYEIRVLSGYDADIGSESDPVVCSLSGDDASSPARVIFEGSGNLYLKLDSGDNTGCDLVYCNGTGAVYLYSDVAADEYDLIICEAGTLTIDDDVSVDRIIQTAGTIIGGIGIDDASDNKTELYIYGGTITWDSQIGNAYIHNALFYWGSSTNEGLLTATYKADYIEVVGTGVFYWGIEHSVPATVSKLKKFRAIGGGKVEVSSVTGVAGAKQIGESSGDISEVFSGSYADMDNGQGNITVHADCGIVNFGGTLNTPIGEEISW